MVSSVLHVLVILYGTDTMVVFFFNPYLLQVHTDVI